MGKPGTFVVPAKLRKQFGLKDACLLVIGANPWGIRLRPASVYEPEGWSTEQTAYYILVNCMTKEGWDWMIPDVVKLGVGPEKIGGIELNYRGILLADEEWDEQIEKPKRDHAPARLRA